MDLNAHRITKTYFWETPLFVNEAQITAQKIHVVYLHGYAARRLGQLSNFSVKLRLFSSLQTRVLGAQNNLFIKAVVLSTCNIFLLRIRKNNFLLPTLICGTGELPPLTCKKHVLLILLEVNLGTKQKHTKILSNPSLYKNSYLCGKNKFNYAVYIYIHSSNLIFN